MKKQGLLKKFSGALTPITYSPTQSLIDLDLSSPWSREIILDPNIRRYSRHRLKLLSKLDDLFRRVPDVQMDFGEALALGLIEEHELAPIYRILIKILSEEEYSERLLLYFPVELIPGNDWKIHTGLARVVEDFTEVYIRKWHTLLFRQDTRANFVNGDIPEIEICSGPLPKVVKAAHLIPALINKGILSYHDVQVMIEECSSEVLRKSIQEILPFCLTRLNTPPNDRATVCDFNWLAKYIESNSSKLESFLDNYYLTGSQKKPKKRIEWEMERYKTISIDGCAEEISQALIDETLDPKILKDFLKQTKDDYSTLVVITSLQKACDTLVQTDFNRASRIYLEFESLIDSLWRGDKLTIQECVEIFWSHLLVSNVIKRDCLEERGVRIVNFEEVYLSQDTCSIVEKIVSEIRKNTELSSLIIPVVIVYGSQVKGYVTKRTDLDIAIFTCPGVDINKRRDIQRHVSNILKPLGVTTNVLEFWTEGNCKEGIRIRNFSNPDRLLGDSTLVHVLFGGIWCGYFDSLCELHKALLSTYLKQTDEIIQEQPLREFWLEEIERDTLQYRLMHRGYHRFYPERKTACIPKTIVDSEGAFWDSGFRRLATKLFLRKVFLPTVRNEQK